MILTYKYKLRDGARSLGVAARKVNFIWNYCNETSYTAISRDGKFLSGFDLQRLTTGSSKLLKLNSQTIQAVCDEYAAKRKKAKKRKLKWRASGGVRRALGWVPFNGQTIKVSGSTITYYGEDFEMFLSRPISGSIKTGSFNQDACGDWYVNFQCEVAQLDCAPVKEVGIDLGLKDLAATSDGQIFKNPKSYRRNEERLGKAQRARKKRRARRIHRKIARTRLDHLHKVSTELTETYHTIFVGNLNLAKGKSTNDASYRGLITLLGYKAIRRQGEVIPVNEMFSTVTCNQCLAKTGPQGLDGLAVREWACASCGQTHDRDINAAINILRLGHETPKILSKPLAS